MNFLRNIFAFLLMPAVGTAGYVLIKDFLCFTVSVGNKYILFWIGLLCYAVFQIVLYKPMKTYVFGHELSHALAGILSGAGVKKFNVSKKSGSVVLTKDNIWITLAPYFFPVYTFALTIIYIFLGWFTDIKQFYGYFLFFTGFSIAFHVAITIYVLNIGQPDLKVYGKFFSYILIFAVNIIVFALLAALAFPYGINVKNIFLKMFKNIIVVYKFIYIGALDAWLAFQKMK